MSASRKRAFIVMDLDGYTGNAADLAGHIEEVMPESVNVTVYASLPDLVHDKLYKVDIFQDELPPIRKPSV